MNINIESLFNVVREFELYEDEKVEEGHDYYAHVEIYYFEMDKVLSSDREELEDYFDEDEIEELKKGAGKIYSVEGEISGDDRDFSEGDLNEVEKKLVTKYEYITIEQK